METDFEEYYTQCGELYLTVKGNIVFHCTLCEKVYKKFIDYAHHTKIHYQEYTDTEKDEEEISTDAAQDEEALEMLEIKSEKTGSFKIQTKTTGAVETADISVAKNEAEAMQTVQLYNIPSLGKKINLKLQYKPIKESKEVRKYKCLVPNCNYACPDKSNIKSHIKRHSLHKKHKCQECFKAFHTRSELEVHVRGHTGEKPYLCTLCGMAFITSSRLSQHRKRHYNNRDKICTICNYACYDTTTLRKHLETHSSERKFKCTQCNSSFKARVALWNHIKIHENKKEYACKLCESKFNQFAGLYSHMKSSHTVIIEGNKIKF